MKQATKQVYEAFDGKQFDTAAECQNHEKSNGPMRLVGLSADQVAAALDRSDPELAKVIEDAGNRIAKARRASGELRRRPAAESESAEVPAP